ncbi:MAG: ribosome hibernation-promoting factor, HPF/YfiA family [Desulfovibrio sp.]|uniref:ribosome hibernation-promoting factor, HPF/YfiA family n=1 Tax=Desulfovibrio sp. 7SRBS1 TaxID=3378064 RepID=UPI003B410F04
MNMAFNFKNFEPSDHLKNYASNRFGKLAKYFNNLENVDVQVNLSVEKFRQMAEVIVVADNLHLSAYEESEDMYATTDMVLDKVVAQVKKSKAKKQSRRDAMSDKVGRMEAVLTGGSDDGSRRPAIVHSDKFEVKPMDLDEAAMKLHSLNYEFLVFRNAANERVNVLYKRNDGDFGLIDPGM